jgi:hypothetical protein
MLIAVSKKNILNRLSGQFGAFARGKENIANATKQTKHRVIGRINRRDAREEYHPAGRQKAEC